MTREARHLAMGLGVILVWSACFVVINASRADAPPRLYAGLRALLGGLPLLAVAANRGVALPPSRAWGWIMLLAVTNTTIGLGGMFLSVGLAGAALPAVLANSQALLVAPFAALLFGERLTLGRLAGLLVGFVGVGLTLMSGAGAPGSREGALAGLIFLGLVGSAGASWVWYRLVRDSELIPLNALTLLTPAFAFALAVAIYREPVTSEALIGIAAVLVGVAWVAWPRQSVLASA